jgi:hypothetical protein
MPSVSPPELPLAAPGLNASLGSLPLTPSVSPPELSLTLTASPIAQMAAAIESPSASEAHASPLAALLSLKRKLSRAEGPSSVQNTLEETYTGGRAKTELILEETAPIVGEAQQDSANPRRNWSFMVLQVAGHGLAPDFDSARRSLNREGTTKRAYITVRNTENGKITDYAALTKTPRSSGAIQIPGPDAPEESASQPLHLSQEELTSFLVNSARVYPGEHYLVSLESHSKQLRQSLPEVHAALAALSRQIGKKIDILLIDSCFMAQVEVATAFKDVARYMVASEESVVHFRPPTKIAKKLKDPDTSPKDLADIIVKTNHEFTSSAIDLDKIDGLNKRIKVLGTEILKVRDVKGLQDMRAAVEKSTHYYREGIVKPGTFMNTMDFYSFVKHLLATRDLRAKFPGLMAACRDILDYFGSPETGIVISERHSRLISRYFLDITNVRGSHGLSMYFPTAPQPFRTRYTFFPNSLFDAETGWNGVIAHLTSTRTPRYLATSIAKTLAGLTIFLLNATIQHVDGWDWVTGLASYLTPRPESQPVPAAAAPEICNDIKL